MIFIDAQKYFTLRVTTFDVREDVLMRSQVSWPDKIKLR